MWQFSFGGGRLCTDHHPSAGRLGGLFVCPRGDSLRSASQQLIDAFERAGSEKVNLLTPDEEHRHKPALEQRYVCSTRVDNSAKLINPAPQRCSHLRALKLRFQCAAAVLACEKAAGARARYVVRQRVGASRWPPRLNASARNHPSRAPPRWRAAGHRSPSLPRAPHWPFRSGRLLHPARRRCTPARGDAATAATSPMSCPFQSCLPPAALVDHIASSTHQRPIAVSPPRGEDLVGTREGRAAPTYSCGVRCLIGTCSRLRRRPGKQLASILSSARRS